MNVIDFGKNTFQCEIAFRFDCLSADGYWILGNAVTSKDPGWHFGKDAQHGLILTKGDGSRERPFRQVKFAADKVVLWAGWNFGYDRWIPWCKDTIDNMAPSKGFPSIYVLQLSTQVGIIVPNASVRNFSEIPELKPLNEFYRTYVPETFLARGASHLLFSTEDSTRTMEIQVIGSPATQESSITFVHKWTTVDAQRSIVENLSDHLAAFDELFSKYHDAVIRPSIIA